ncbi:unnamed protein product [Durusdinium trenchii]|uniref:J domain-containing protein n=1 Tax=Durusdinium trenchii TaxID=1381693 RepID=A0ABP0I0I0_9DINO
MGPLWHMRAQGGMPPATDPSGKPLREEGRADALVRRSGLVRGLHTRRQQMSVKQLQSECWRRRIPYIPQTRVSHIILLETENPHADEHGDLVRRLMQDAYPGSPGPLPARGVSGVWTPGAGSFSPGGERLPAWTGTVASGFEAAEASPQGAWQAPSGVPGGMRPPPRSTPKSTPNAGPYGHGWQQGASGTSSGSSANQRPQDRRRSDRAFPEVVVQDIAGAEHYQTLGLQPTATVVEVRKAYRKLALKYHPDKSKDVDDGARFKELSIAYQALCELLD